MTPAKLASKNLKESIVAKVKIVNNALLYFSERSRAGVS